MKNLKIEKLLEFSILSFGLFPLIPTRLYGVQVALFLIFALVYFFNERPTKLNYKTFFINSSLYLCYLISLFYTSDYDKAFKVLSETRLTIFLLPFVFLFISNTKEVFSIKTLNKLKNTFIFSTFLFCIIYVIYLPFIPLQANPFFNFPSVYFFRNGLLDIPLLGVHPIYGSLYIGVAIIFIFSNFIKNKTIDKKQFFFLVFFILVLLLLTSKMVIISLMMIIFSYYFLKKNLKQKIILIGSTIIVVFALIQVPTIKNRTKELLKKETFIKYNRHNSTSIRINILKCGFELASTNLFLGLGVGDVNNELVNCYKSISNDLVYERYNSHNQYMSILLGCGIFGLFIFCYFLYQNILLGSVLEDKSFYYFIIFYGINFLSENILERQNGVILFYFLICYFSNYWQRNLKRV